MTTFKNEITVVFERQLLCFLQEQFGEELQLIMQELQGISHHRLTVDTLSSLREREMNGTMDFLTNVVASLVEDVISGKITPEESKRLLIE